MKLTIFTIFFFGSFFVRILRWLGIIQQKEYRFDRLMLFMKSYEGKQEFYRLLPKKSDFSKTGLKRPKITLRSASIGFIFSTIFILFLIVVLLLAYLIPSLLFTILFFIICLLILLTCIPFILIISIIPTTIIASFKTHLELLKAKSKFRKTKPMIIGITGSYGKTSTKIFLAHVLERKFSVFKTPKSFNIKYSVAKSINDGYLDQEIAIIEYAAYKTGEIKNLTSWFKPKLAVVTGLTEQHLGLFGSLSAIIQAKAELVESLDLGSTVICNGYDPGALRIFEMSRNKKDLKLVSINEQHDQVKIFKTHLNKKGELVFVWNGQQVLTKLMGMHYIQTVKLVIAVATELDLKDEEIVSALSNFIPNEKFIYSYTLDSGATVVDDGGTSNPKGFEAAISLASKVNAKEKTLITPGIIDLGLRSDDIHKDLAERSQQIFSNVLYVGEVGSKQFGEAFGDNFEQVQSEVEKKIAEISSDNLVLVEGRMPAWVKKVLK